MLLYSIAKQQILVAMSDADAANSLVAYIELAMRRASLSLPPWRYLALDDMRMLWHNLAQLVPSLQVILFTFIILDF